MDEFVDSFLLVYAGLFPIVNPIGGAPIFLGLTRNASKADRKAMARGIAIAGFFLLLGSLFLGAYVLEFFGITLPVVRIAGGLVVTAFAWQMLHSGSVIDTPSPDEADDRRLGRADVFYPLTMPLTVGPGSIAVAITLGSQRPPGIDDNLADLAALAGGAIAGLVAVAATIYVCYRFAERIGSFLGAGGTNVLVRLSAFVLLCIGIQIVWAGYAALMLRAA